MYPRFLECTQCGDRLSFPDTDRAYYLGESNTPDCVADEEYFRMLLIPIWCFDCEAPSWAEDIPEVSYLESQALCVKAGKVIEYPFYNEFMSAGESITLIKHYMKLSLCRSNHKRCVLCEGDNIEVLAGSPTKLKHEHCDYGVYKPVYTVSSQNSDMKTTLYNLDGHKIGRLSCWDDTKKAWLSSA